MSLKVVAISAPEFPFGRLNTASLISRDPVGLYNACRYAAFLADNRLGAWGDSNWAVSRRVRKDNFLLMNSLAGELSYFEELLARKRPNLLLIGSMTICFAGAIECAKIAKQMFGDEIFIVLGGRHANETIYTDKNRFSVKHHNGSPLKLMAENRIDNVFDLVVSGEGEFVVAKIGEIVAEFAKRPDAKKILSRILSEEMTFVPGKWIVGSINDGSLKTIISKGIVFNRDQLPSPAKMFGVNAVFKVFDGSLTGHAFSDMGPGCIYDCDFCSERNSVCGPLAQVETSANRLFRQLKDIRDVIQEDSPGRRASAFVEDSIILGGLASQLNKLNDMTRDHPIDIEFGGQLTVDLAIRQKDIMRELVSRGLKYVFIGLETSSPSLIGGMSKDIGKGEWLERVETMISEYTDIGVKIGVAILFGLGEDQTQRMSLLEHISDWRKDHGNPVVVSFNLAVQHPLMGRDNDAGYDYVSWAVNEPEYLAVLNDYGEASTIYGIPGIMQPTLAELLELGQLRKKLNI